MWTDRSRRFCDALGIRLPIVQGPMAGGVVGAELVAETSNAGGLGCLAGGYVLPDRLSGLISATRGLTDRPFGVNLFVPPAEPPKTAAPEALLRLEGLAKELGVEFDPNPTVVDHTAELLDLVLADPPRFVSFTFGLPSRETVDRLHERGSLVAVTVTNLAEAGQAEALGCDAVVAQGSEAGGHRGTFIGEPEASLVGTLAFVPAVVDAVKVPVIAAGGVMDGRSIVACLALGASAVQMGTAFLTTTESLASPVWKEAVRGADGAETLLTRGFSGKPVRSLRNRFTEQMAGLEESVAGYPRWNDLTTPLRRKATSEGKADYMSLYMGQRSSAARAVSVRQLVGELEREVAACLGGFD